GWGALAAYGLDQASKLLVLHSMSLGRSWPLWGDAVRLTYIQNPGSAFGLLASAPAIWRVPFFCLVTLGASVMIYAFQRFLPPGKAQVRRLALGLVWGGALGNFTDRIWLGKVIDFIDVGYRQYRWPVFNLADSCITVGLACLVLEMIFRDRH
ncbi:MAG TPA: signal peptidase II, partial [bacterium]|nr:signal peptidase II [bacterium]